MARPTASWRAALFSTSNNASPYSAAPTWTPAANSLIVCFVCTNATTAVDPTSVSAHGVSLTKVLGGVTAAAANMLSVWVGDAGASPTSAAASATIGGSPTGCVVDEFEVTNWGTSAGAIAAILQTNTATGTATSGTTAIRLVPQTVNESGYLSFYIHIINEASFGQGGNWVADAGGTGSYNLPPTGAIGQCNNTGYTATATASWTTSATYASIVIEVQGSTASSPRESLKISDTVTARLNPQPILVPAESLKVSDSATVLENPLIPAPVNESLKVSASGFANAGVAVGGIKISASGRIDLIGEGVPLRITDVLTQPVLVSSGGNLTPSPTPQESLKVSDQATVLENPLFAAPATESLKVSASGRIDLIGVGAALKITDGSIANGNLQVLLGNFLTPSPTPSESLKVSDTVSPSITPVFLTVTAESLHVTDEVTIAEGRDEVIHCTDGSLANGLLIVQRVDPGADLTPSPQPSESLKVSDQVTVVENPLFTPTLTDSLKVSDSATVLENPLVGAPADESLKVSDSATVLENPLFAAPTTESLKVVDGSIANGQLSVFRIEGGDLVPTPTPSESLKVSDQATVLENPLFAEPALETLKVQDQAFAAIELFALPFPESLHVVDTLSPPPVLIDFGTLVPTPQPGDSLKVSDDATALLNPETVVVGQEALKVQDQAVAALQLAVSIPSESLKVADQTANAVINLAASATESVRLTDTPTVLENPLQTTGLQESLHVVDQVTIVSGMVVQATETIHVTDSLAPPILFNPSQAAPDYTVRIPADDVVVIVPEDVSITL